MSSVTVLHGALRVPTLRISVQSTPKHCIFHNKNNKINLSDGEIFQKEKTND